MSGIKFGNGNNCFDLLLRSDGVDLIYYCVGIFRGTQKRYKGMTAG
jgi:hypothetical protein